MFFPTQNERSGKRPPPFRETSPAFGKRPPAFRPNTFMYLKIPPFLYASLNGETTHLPSLLHPNRKKYGIVSANNNKPEKQLNPDKPSITCCNGRSRQLATSLLPIASQQVNAAPEWNQNQNIQST